MKLSILKKVKKGEIFINENITFFDLYYSVAPPGQTQGAVPFPSPASHR